jgi:phosphatidylglycerophosphatase A
LDRRERLRVLLATGFGLGRAPVAPGTFGSLGGLALFAALARMGGTPLALAGAACVAAAGFWSAGAAAARFGVADPGPVVIDEIAGQMVALLFLPLTAPALIAGFALFRVFDILKPFPAGRAERLPGASGIMADDLVAGVYANVVQQAVSWGLAGGWGSA